MNAGSVKANEKDPGNEVVVVVVYLLLYLSPRDINRGRR